MHRRQPSERWRATLVAWLAIACAGPSCGGGGGAPAGGSGGAGSGLGGAAATGMGGQTGGAAGGSGSGGATGNGTAPGAFALASPLHGSSAQSLTPMLQWDPADGATAYRVEVASSASFATADVVDQTVTGGATSFAVTASRNFS